MSDSPLLPSEPAPGPVSDATSPPGIQVDRPVLAPPDVVCPRCGKSVPWLCLLCPHCEEPLPSAVPDFGIRLGQQPPGAAAGCLGGVGLFTFTIGGAVALQATLDRRPSAVIGFLLVVAITAALANIWRSRLPSVEGRPFPVDFLTAAGALASVGFALLVVGVCTAVVRW